MESCPKHKKLSWEFILFEREENAIYKQQTYNMRQRSQDQKQTNKTQPRESCRFFNQSEKAGDFPSLCDYFKAIYTCVSFCSSTLYQVKRVITLRLMLLSDTMTLLTSFRLQSNKVKLFSKTARFLSL